MRRKRLIQSKLEKNIEKIFSFAAKFMVAIFFLAVLFDQVDEALIIFGNLPYNISIKILSKWIVNDYKKT